MTDTYKQKPDAASSTVAPEKNLTLNENTATTLAEDENPAKPLRYFTTRDAAVHFGEEFLDEDACREWVVSRLHPGGAFCPGCGLKLEDDKSFRAGKRCHCGRCGRWYSATTGTFLDGMHFNFRQVFLLAVLTDLDIAVGLIAPTLGVSADTVRIWQKKFRVLEEHGR